MSESEFYEDFSDQESSDYDDSQNREVEGAVRPYMYEPEVEIGDDLVHEIPGIHNNQDDVEERLGNNIWEVLNVEFSGILMLHFSVILVVMTTPLSRTHTSAKLNSSRFVSTDGLDLTQNRIGLFLSPNHLIHLVLSQVIHNF